MSEAAQEPNMKRRCFVHDYKSRSIYLVTFEVAGRQPRLGRICPQGLTPRAPNRRIAGQGALQEAAFSGEAGRNAAPGRNWRASKIARNAAGEAVAAFETPEFAAKREALFAAAKRGAVLCSPCISDGERALAYAAVDAGCPLIVLRNEPFPPRFKPSGRFFDACAEGRLLMLHPLGLTAGAPNRPAAGRGASAPAITRGECLALNAIAAEICGGDAGEIVYYGLK